MDTGGTISNRTKLYPGSGECNLPNHRDPDWPRRIPDGKTEIRVVGSLVLSLLHVMHDLCQTWEHVVRKRLKNHQCQGEK